jgi:hypothetical protein
VSTSHGKKTAVTSFAKDKDVNHIKEIKFKNNTKYESILSKNSVKDPYSLK